MIKIFRYELHRLVCSKFFWGLFAVLLWYSWQVLNFETILGVANTAPFSPWSFGKYLIDILPLLMSALLFFVWNQYNSQANGIRSLTDATPMKQGHYLLLKYMAILTAWCGLTLILVLLGILFLCTLFGHHVPVASLLTVAAITVLPPASLLLGAGSLVGRFRSWVIFVLMALVLGAKFLPGDIYGASLFVDYPLSLGVLDPVFSMPVTVLIGKIVVTLIGIGLFFFPLLSNKSLL